MRAGKVSQKKVKPASGAGTRLRYFSFLPLLCLPEAVGCVGGEWQPTFGSNALKLRQAVSETTKSYGQRGFDVEVTQAHVRLEARQSGDASKLPFAFRTTSVEEGWRWEGRWITRAAFKPAE